MPSASVLAETQLPLLPYAAKDADESQHRPEQAKQRGNLRHGAQHIQPFLESRHLDPLVVIEQLAKLLP